MTTAPIPAPALVLAAYGSAGTGPLAGLYGDLMHDMRDALPGVRVELAIVSGHVRHALAERGEDARALPDVLAALATDGIRRVAVQPVLVGAGLTLDAVHEDANRERGWFDALSIGEPLLAGEADAEEVAHVLAAAYPVDSVQAVLLVAHGSKRGDGGCGYLTHALASLNRPANCGDDACEVEGQRQSARYVITTMTEGADAAAARLRSQVPDATKVTLVPLMLAAGSHVRRQLVGEAEGAKSASCPSWRASLARCGYAVEVSTDGLLGLTAVRDVFVRHAGRALKALGYEGDA